MSGWLLLVIGVVGAIHVANAWAPRRGRIWLAPSFFASWFTIELAWHHLVLGLVMGFVLVSMGALDTVPGVIGLVLLVLTEAGLAVLAVRSLRTKVQVTGALVDLEPEGDTPRFPRSHVVLPLLMGRRRGVHLVRNIEYSRVAGRRLRLDLTVPSAPPPGGGRRPALVQIHGGAWVIGDKREQGIPLLTHMAAQGWVGVNVNYRLSPAATFPDHLVDCKRAIAWVREHADEHDIDPDFICVTGGSAGGHLTALVALTAGLERFQPGFEHADTSVAAAVPVYGIYDFTRGGAFGSNRDLFRRFLEPWVMKAFVDEEPERFADASPLHHVGPHAPAMAVVHGDLDTLAPVEDARRFVEALREASTEPVVYLEMQGAQHAFEVFPSPRTARVIEGIERFLTTVHARRQAPVGEVEDHLAGSLTD